MVLRGFAMLCLKSDELKSLDSNVPHCIDCFDAPDFLATHQFGNLSFIFK